MGEPECIVRGLVAYVLRLNALFGLTPLSFTKVDDGYRISVSALNRMYCLTLVTIADAVIIYSFKIRASYESSQTQIIGARMSYLVHIMAVTKSMLLITVAVLSASSRLNRLKSYFNLLSEIQFQIRPEALKKENRKYYHFINFWLLFGMFLTLCDLYLYIWDKSIINKYGDGKVIVAAELTLYCSQIFLITLLEIEIVVIAMIPCSVIKSINHILTDMIKNKTHLKNMTRQTKITEENIRRLANSYTSISGAIRQVNYINGFLILGLLVIHLLYIIISAYYLIDYIYNQRLPLFWIIVQALWLVYDIMNLFILVEPGFRTEQEVANTLVLLSQLMNEATGVNSVLARELELFQRALELNNFAHRPMGTCEVSRGLAVTILGSVTTYLVVIVQMNFGV